MSTEPVQAASSASTPPLLAELSESRAQGSTRHIYDEIRRLSAVPMVALIWRHLATLPGALEWAWSLLGPAMRAGAVQQVAAQLATQARVQRRPAIPAAALQAIGIGAADVRSITAVLDAYNRANPVNIVMVRCLSMLLAEAPACTSTHVWPLWQPPAAPPALPTMVDPAAMSPTVRAMVLLLTDRSAAAAPSTLWPSLYRHLAQWPAFLGLATVIVPPEFEAIDAVAVHLRDQVDLAAAELAQHLPHRTDRPAPRPADPAALLSAIHQFSGRIPEMVVIGNLLRDALPSDAE